MNKTANDEATPEKKSFYLISSQISAVVAVLSLLLFFFGQFVRYRIHNRVS